MERYKIAIVSDWYLPRVGGVELHLRDLAKALANQGHEVHVLTSTPGESIGDHGMVHRLKAPMLAVWDVVYDLRAFEAVRELIKRERYDIIHAHSVYSPLGVIALYQAHRLGVPTVFTNHSLLRENAVLSLLSRRIFRSWINKADCMTAVSHAAADDVRRASGGKEVIVIPNGIFPKEWEPQAPKPTSTLFQIASVMRLTLRKQPMELIRALPAVLGRISSEQARQTRVAIVGDGRQRKTLERAAKRLGVSDRVVFHGQQPREVVRQILAGSRLFVLPTSKEAFGIAILEARASGVPVVAMNHGGVGDVIDHGQQGLLVNTRDELVDGIVQMIEDHSLRERFAQRARDGMERFSWERVLQQYLDVYAQAMAKRGTKRR